MFIPGYQIHNILKDFTLQLKKQRQGLPPEGGRPARPPHPATGPDQLRLATVVTKVTDNIMHRIASLGRESGSIEGGGITPSATTDIGLKARPAAFDYHLVEGNGAKVKKRLVFRDSRSLVERFQHLTSADEPNGGEKG